MVSIQVGTQAVSEKPQKHVRQDLGLLYGAERENSQDANLFESEVASTVPRNFSSVPLQMHLALPFYCSHGSSFSGPLSSKESCSLLTQGVCICYSFSLNHSSPNLFHLVKSYWSIRYQLQPVAFCYVSTTLPSWSQAP